MSELKPCPFCGVEVEQGITAVGQEEVGYVVHPAGNCLLSNKMYNFTPADFGPWNTRDNTELNHCCVLLIEAGISTGHGDSFTELVEECIANVVEARRNKV